MTTEAYMPNKNLILLPMLNNNMQK